MEKKEKQFMSSEELKRMMKEEPIVRAIVQDRLAYLEEWERRMSNRWRWWRRGYDVRLVGVNE